MLNISEGRSHDKKLSEWFNIMDELEPGFEMRIKYAVRIVDKVRNAGDLADALKSYFFSTAVWSQEEIPEVVRTTFEKVESRFPDAWREMSKIALSPSLLTDKSVSNWLSAAGEINSRYPRRIKYLAIKWASGGELAVEHVMDARTMFDAIVEVLAMPCKRLEEWFEEISTATSSRSDPARGSDEMVVDNLEVDLWLSEAEVMNVESKVARPRPRLRRKAVTPDPQPAKNIWVGSYQIPPPSPPSALATRSYVPRKWAPKRVMSSPSTGGRSELEDEGNEEDETLLSQEPVRVPKKAEPREKKKARKDRKRRKVRATGSISEGEPSGSVSVLKVGPPRKIRKERSTGSIVYVELPAMPARNVRRSPVQPDLQAQLDLIEMRHAAMLCCVMQKLIVGS